MSGGIVTPAAALNPQRRIDYIAPLPYSSNIELSPEGALTPRLSFLSQVAVAAAVATWERQPESKLVLTGETCFGPDLPNTTDLLVKRALELDVPAESIVRLDKLADGRALNNTYLQLRALREFSSDRESDVLLLPLEYHAKRVGRAAHALGMLARVAVAEGVLAECGQVVHQDMLDVIALLAPSERRLMRISHLSPRGGLLNLVTRVTGARLIDVHERPNGRVDLEQDLARRKLHRLQRQAANG